MKTGEGVLKCVAGECTAQGEEGAEWLASLAG